jgi:hypothetical protein
VWEEVMPKSEEEALTASIKPKKEKKTSSQGEASKTREQVEN